MRFLSPHDGSPMSVINVREAENFSPSADLGF